MTNDKSTTKKTITNEQQQQRHQHQTDVVLILRVMRRSNKVVCQRLVHVLVHLQVCRIPNVAQRTKEHTRESWKQKEKKEKKVLSTYRILVT